MSRALIAASIVAALSGAGCTTAEQRAGGGAAIGAGTGALIGALATGRPGGALAGAALGGVTGAMVGAATTPPPYAGPVVVERVRARPAYVEEEIELPPRCRTRVERSYDDFGDVEVRRTRVCR
jgi:outer membrane protein with glycine zipper